ncbi:MAG: hypothetical protein NVS4B3_16510 [Gemmatimonadaceae bacterium]
MVALLLLTGASVPAIAGAQWGSALKQRIVDGTAQKVAEKSARAETTLAKAADKAADSTLDKTERGANFVVTKAGDVVDAGLNKTEAGMSGLFAGKETTADQIAAELSAGRVVLRNVAFTPGTAQLAPGSDRVLTKVAKAIGATPGTYLLEGHVATVDPSSPTLSEQRANAVKVRLIELGVTPQRLFAMGLGASRPVAGTAAGAETNERIEVAKMQ